MATKNTLVNQKETISGFLGRVDVKKKVMEVVGGKNADRFVTSIVSSVSANPNLNKCDRSSILNAALLGQALNLSPSPQLGHYYMAPFDDKQRGPLAQFILGYKGYIQLAIRSGQYKNISVKAIKEGELIRYDSLDETIEVKVIEDTDVREGTPTIGYYAMFELINGFTKRLYWSKKQMEAHAKKYSFGYVNDLKKGTKYTFWSKDFDGMANKTMIRQLISKWGIMSIDLQDAIERDMAVIHDNGSEYVDNDLEMAQVYETEAKEVQNNESSETDDEEEQTDIEAMFFASGDNA